MNWRSIRTRRTYVQSEADQWRPHANGFHAVSVRRYRLMTAIVGCRTIGDFDGNLALVELFATFLLENTQFQSREYTWRKRTRPLMHIHLSTHTLSRQTAFRVSGKFIIIHFALYSAKCTGFSRAHFSPDVR